MTWRKRKTSHILGGKNMEKKIQKIIEKVRLMARYNPQIKELVLEQRANINIKEGENGELLLYSIKFAYYDALYIYENKMIYVSDSDKKTTLFEYSGWDDFLAM